MKGSAVLNGPAEHTRKSSSPQSATSMMAPSAAMGIYWKSHDSVGSTHSTTTHITCHAATTNQRHTGVSNGIV